jgi:uncharacterized protein (TIGR02145 family)
MGFIRNFEIWTNQRPRVCNFDVLDYCAEGVIGNSCTGIVRPIDATTEDNAAMARSTRDAWLKAVNEYALALNAFYFENGTGPNPPGGYPELFDQNNVKCITPTNYGKFLNLYYGPTGFTAKYYKEWLPASQLWWNCLYMVGSPEKKTGVYTYTIPGIPTAPNQGGPPFTYTIDYTNYQVATKARYLEYRVALDAMLAALKIFMQSGGKQPVTPYDIVPQPCPEITIGTQIWKRCNLSVTKYRNGDTIPQVTDPIAWGNLTTGAWCYYDNDPTTEPIYGRLYNWYAVNDPRGLAPTGYHIPTDKEWGLLVDYVRGSNFAGGILKMNANIGSDGDCIGWEAPSTSTNERGFTALPAGYRLDDGVFYNQYRDGFWWTQTQFDITSAYNYNMNYNSPGVGNGTGADFATGLSVRVLKGETPVECPDVTIGTQTWTRCNLNTAFYRNGDPIPQVTDPIQWGNLTTGAWCYYNNDPSNEAIYGKLYNWYALNDSRGLAPTGYHLPTDTEWTTLTDYLGGDIVAGGKMKRAGTLGAGKWAAPNTDGTNESMFTGLPGGFRIGNGTFVSIIFRGYWWSSTEFIPGIAWARLLVHDAGYAGISFDTMNYGLSVRLVKD